LALRPHEQCPAWNYTVVPRMAGAQGSSIVTPRNDQAAYSLDVSQAGER